LNFQFRATKFRLPLALSVLAFVAAGCGPSGIATTPIGRPTAPPLTGSAAFANTSVVTPAASSTSTTVSEPLPGGGSYSGTIALPLASVPSNLQLSLSYSSSAPSGIGALSAARATTVGTRSPLDGINSDAVYACFQSNAAITLNAAPQYTFTLPPAFAPSGSVFYLAIFQGGQWAPGYGGPGTVANTSSSTTVTIAGIYGFTVAPNQPVCVALFARWSNDPSPTPATPLPTPSPTSTPFPVLASSALTFTGIGVSQSLGVTETGYTNAFSESDTCSGIATVSTTSANGPSATYSVTSVATGACAITISDNANHAVTAQVDVTTSNLNLQSGARR
jgi:hypothetical protein